MKPLLMAPLTFEDVLIWARILKRNVDPGGESCVLRAWEAADRRDAVLMLGAQLQPLCIVHWRAGLDHLILLRGPPTGERLEWLD